MNGCTSSIFSSEKMPPAPTPNEIFFGSSPKKRLNQWLATGICGNDISSSCLYVSAIAAVFAGALAPVVLLLVVFLLYLYKKVYIEVVEALPLNGGTYNCLLNSTSKFAEAVLSGAVLTSFVGVTGLVQRMVLDQCLPQFLLKKNRRGTSHRIIISFFLLCTSIMLVTRGNLNRLSTAFDYIVNNESSRSVLVLHLYNHPGQNEESSLKKSLRLLEKIFPMLQVELIVREAKFGPKTVDAVSREFGVPVNNIFTTNHRLPICRYCYIDAFSFPPSLCVFL